MKWEKIKYPDKEGTFSVRLFGQIATRSDGIKIAYQDEGIVMILKNGEEWLCRWANLFADFEANAETNDS